MNQDPFGNLFELPELAGSSQYGTSDRPVELGSLLEEPESSHSYYPASTVSDNRYAVNRNLDFHNTRSSATRSRYANENEGQGFTGPQAGQVSTANNTSAMPVAATAPPQDPASNRIAELRAILQEFDTTGMYDSEGLEF